MKYLLLIVFSLIYVSAFSQEENNAWLLKERGKNYQLANQFDSAIFSYNQALELTKELPTDTTLSSVLYQLSLVYLSTGQNQKALNHAFSALEIDKKNKDYESIAASLNAIALIYQQSDIYDKALEYQLESIKISEENNRSEDIANGYYNLGNIYLKFDKSKKALEYFNVAKDSYSKLLKNDAKNIQLNLSLSETLYSVGEVYLNLKEYNLALEYFNKAKEIKIKHKDIVGLSNTWNKISDTYTFLGNYDEAIGILFSKSLPLKIQIGDKKGISIIYSNIGHVHYKRNDLTSAENFLLKSNEYALQANNKEAIMVNSGLLSEIYQKQNLLEKSLEYLQLYTSTKDSLTVDRNLEIVEEMSVRFETDKKEQENQILSLTVQRQNTVRNYLSGIILLVILIVLVIYRQYLQKKNTNKIISKKNTLLEVKNTQINEQKAVIETKNKDLTDSIEYAKRIQESLLSKTNELLQKLDDAFILFKPKDIVSGDFYWTGEKNGKLIISAVDCTGHGVPGAFMSMLGDSYLNHIVYNQEITSPEQILTELDKNIKSALKQEDTNNQDGMDMALCTLDLKTKTIEFAGAKNPLVYIQNGEVFKVKGSRQPIGGSIEKGNGFEKHEIRVKDSASFYMFSDGYPDQFGGPNNKKFMAKNLQKLLLENHEKSMAEQQLILDNAINYWMKDYEQIDDILVVGFKIT